MLDREVRVLHCKGGGGLNVPYMSRRHWFEVHPQSLIRQMIHLMPTVMS